MHFLLFYNKRRMIYYSGERKGHSLTTTSSSERRMKKKRKGKHHKRACFLLFICCFSLPLMSACLSRSHDCFWGLGLRPTSSTDQRASHSLPALVFPSKKSRRDNASKTQRENPTTLTDLGTAMPSKMFYNIQYTLTNSK